MNSTQLSGLSAPQVDRLNLNTRHRRLPRYQPLRPEQSKVDNSAIIEAQISSLKVLALSLLARIESLEEQGANSEMADLNLQVEVHRFEAELIRNALIKTGGRQRRAAKLLSTKVTTLNTKIRKYQISLDNDRAV